MELSVILYAILAAVVYSASHYLKKSASDPKKFDFMKFLSTVIVGAGVGLYFAYMNTPITEQSVTAQLALLTGIIAIVENVLKWMYRAIKSSTKVVK